MISSINDKPISRIDDDRLKISSYVDALSSFIIEGETPLTIGLQGEWGTGKTSMMNLIREQIIEEQVPTCWLNTWEHSLFTDPVETTPKLLRAMINNVKNDNLSKEFVDANKESNFEKVGKTLAAIANQALIKKTGVNLQSALNPVAGDDLEISALKSDVKDVLQNYISSTKNRHKRIVFFIDDLDRIEPSRAVEILEALKNLLDFDGCVFVLAIDYEVVVSGLKLKFGERKDKNDREFRSFFDKIIQVPFHIPTDKYEIKNFLEEKFNSFETIEPSDQFIEDCEFFVKNTIGYNPRALKRQLNLYNLTSRILLQDEEERVQEGSVEIDNSSKQSDQLALFALICVQVAYDDLFKTIIASVNDLSDLSSKNKVFDNFWEDPKHDLLKKFKPEIESILGKFEEKEWLKQDSTLTNALSYAAVTGIGVTPIREKKARSEIPLEEYFEINKVKKFQRDLIKKFQEFVATLQSPLVLKATNKKVSFYDQKNRDKKNGVICYLDRKKDGLLLDLKGGNHRDGNSNQKLEELGFALERNGMENVNFEIDARKNASLKVKISPHVLEKQFDLLANAFAEHKKIYAYKGWYKESKNAE